MSLVASAADQVRVRRRRLGLASSAARSRIRSSSVMACQRVARRCPVRRTRWACSSSRSRASTWSRSAPACWASAAVVRPSLSASSCSAVSAVKRFLVVLRRRRRFGFGVDSWVEDAVEAAPLPVSAERAVSSDVISEFSCSMRPSMDWMSCWSEDMTGDRKGGRGSLTAEVQGRSGSRVRIRRKSRSTQTRYEVFRRRRV